jgi:uncharacterized membrane protein
MLAAIAAAASLGGCGGDDAANDNRATAAPAPSATAPASEPAPATSNAAAPSAPAPAANGAAAAPAPHAGPFSPSGYALNGAEPFWGGTVTGTRVRYMTPENQFGSVVETARTLGATEVYRGRLGGRPFVLTLSRAPCSDGMSDRSYRFTALLEVRGETRRGCADPE